MRGQPFESTHCAVKDLVLSHGPTLNHVDYSIHITVNMGEAPACVGRDLPRERQVVDGLIARTGMSVSTRVLTTSVNVSNKAQKNLGGSTHPIRRTRSMQMIILLSYGADGMTYVKAPTSDGQWVE